MSENEDFTYPIQVRYNECDPTGFAFNANFFVWAQEACAQYWKDLGVDVVALAMNRQTFMAVHLSCDYRRPVGYGDLVRIKPSVAELNGSSIHIRYLIFKGDDVVAEVRSVHVFMDTKAKKSLPLTDELRKKLLPERKSNGNQ
jgi:YbgC/YbaW family acyl-CoA thioester hydrolase